MATQGKSNGFIDRIRIVQTSVIFFVLCPLIGAGASMVLLDMDVAHYRSDGRTRRRPGHCHCCGRQRGDTTASCGSANPATLRLCSLSISCKSCGGQNAGEAEEDPARKPKIRI